MKNLRLLVNLKHSIDLLSDSDQFTFVSSDFSNNIFKRKGYVYVYNRGDIFTLNTVNGESCFSFSIKHFYNDDTQIVALFYNSILNSLNIAMVKGDMLSVSLDEECSPMDEIQCLGSIDSGLKAAVISPDMETIVLLTCDNLVLLMSSNFDPINESNLFGTDQGEQEMVNVGWGKKETQFHGSEGKAAAKKKNTDESTIINLLQEKEDVKISWRGDSALFAVSYWCEGKHQKIKIYDKSGVLQCTSEYIPGLEGTLSWRPSGNLIALAQQLPNKYVICFMEKNGLRHGDFTLPPHVQVLELSWNSESTILSAVCEDKSVKQFCVLLWTTGNYHWYLKQRLVFDSAVVALHWDDVIGNLAHILLADGQFLVYQWTWTVDHSAGFSDEDLAAVAVIDGCDLKLSAFKKCIIPPPMCNATIILPCAALQVMFPPFCGENRIEDQNPNDVCVYLSDGRLALIKGLDTAPQLKSVLPIEWKCADSPVSACTKPSSLSHWLWLSADQLLCVVCSGPTYLCHLQLEEESATVLSVMPLEEAVLTVSHRTGSTGGLIQLSSGALLQFQDGCLSPLSELPEPCIVVRCIGSRVFARTHNCRLYVDGEIIASNVTSFFCLPQFLITTLSSHQLCVASSDTGFKVESGSSESGGGPERRVERGSSLVVVVGHSVVLQMPRGNLETIQPRALTLVSAQRLLDAGKYAEVAQLLRRQRIDLNLCVDHNPAVFLVSASRLVGQVRDPQWLSVFLAELSERDVTRTVYAAHYNNVKNRGPLLADKVARVCSALRDAMSQSAEDRAFFLQPILSTFVRAGRVGEAIALADTDQALGYLTLLIDTDRLYEEALASYNLDKALKIAGKSLKDPKEYVVYLNELQAMDPAYMRFTIDKRLRKSESALHNLAQCSSDRHAECLKYIKDTGLYSLGLQLFNKPEFEGMQRDICHLYGCHLEQQRSYHEAAIMYRRAGQLDKCLAMFIKAGCWRQSLTLVAQMDYCDSEIDKLHESLYSALVSGQQHAEAAQLCAQLGWLDKAISCWVEAHRWSEAVQLCEGPYLALIESVVKPTLKDCQSRTIADIRSKREEMEKLSARLLVVRHNKANQPHNYDALSDIQSDTSSLSSFSTSSAGTRTTKNTRKAQRKLWSLKEGNPREEQALLYTITELIRNTETLTGEVHSTCLALCELGMDDLASGLQTAMAEILDRTERLRATVWPAHSVKKTGSDADAMDPTAIDTQLNYPPTSCIATSWKLKLYL